MQLFLDFASAFVVAFAAFAYSSVVAFVRFAGWIVPPLLPLRFVRPGLI